MPDFVNKIEVADQKRSSRLLDLQFYINTMKNHFIRIAVCTVYTIQRITINVYNLRLIFVDT